LAAIFPVTFFAALTPITVAIAPISAVIAAFTALRVVTTLLFVPLLRFGHVRTENQGVFQRLWWELVLWVAAATPIATTHDRRCEVQAQVVLGELVVGFCLNVVSGCGRFAGQCGVLVIDLMRIAAHPDVWTIGIKNLIPGRNRTLFLLLWLTPTAVVALPHVVSFALRRKWY
jgi:hypothetical protein